MQDKTSNRNVRALCMCLQSSGAQLKLSKNITLWFAQFFRCSNLDFEQEYRQRKQRKQKLARAPEWFFLQWNNDETRRQGVLWETHAPAESHFAAIGCIHISPTFPRHTKSPQSSNNYFMHTKFWRILELRRERDYDLSEHLKYVPCVIRDIVLLDKACCCCCSRRTLFKIVQWKALSTEQLYQQ